MVFVTGGTGLVGSHLLYRLAAAGKKIRALKRPQSSLDTVQKVFGWYSRPELLEEIEWIEGDLSDVWGLEEAMRGASQVYHCAATISFDPKLADDMRKTNVEGTANMVNAALAAGTVRFCHVSSIAALGEWPDGTVIKDGTFWKGAARDNHYAHTKYGAEREVWRGMEEGLDAVIVNPGVIIGPGNWEQGSPHIFKKIWQGVRFYPPGGANYVDVRDVVKLMVRLAEDSSHSGRFILVSETLSIYDFMKLACSALGKKEPSVKAGTGRLRLAGLMEGTAAFFLNRAPRLTPVMIRALSSTHYYVAERIRGMNNFSFLPVKDSVEYTARLFLEEVTSSSPAARSLPG